MEFKVKKVKWIRVDERNDTSVFPAVFFQSGAGEGPMKAALGTSLAALMQSFEGRKWVWFEVEGDLLRVGTELVEKIKYNPVFVEEKIRETYGFAKPLLALTAEIAGADLTKKSDDELADYYAEYARRLEAMRGPAWIAPALDASEFFSNHLKEILSGYLKKVGKESDLPQYFVTLTAPSKQTLMARNDEALLKLAALISVNSEEKRFFENELEAVLDGLKTRFPELDAALEEHKTKFEWLPCTYENEPWTKAYFVSVVQGIVREGNAERELEKILEKEKRGEEARKRAYAELAMTPEDAKWFDVASELIFFKADRKDVFFKSYYRMRPLMREIAERLALSASEARMMLPKEINEYLRSGSISIAFRDELRLRRAFSVLLSFDDDSTILTGDAARRYLAENLVEEKTVAGESENVLKGSVANVGHARGIARLIMSPTDMPKMHQGEILIAPATNPDVVPAMKKAAAIVTNTGGITCHAAIVSRELSIPCVVGTKRATNVIKDGDVVDVDATAGIIKIIKRARKRA